MDSTSDLPELGDIEDSDELKDIVQIQYREKQEW